MKIDNNDEQLIKKLRQLPKIEDHSDKDDLFRRISTQMGEKKQRKNYRLLPILSTLIVTIIIIAIIPLLIENGMSKTSLNDSGGNMIEESSHKMEMAIEQSDTEQEIQLFDAHVESYVHQSIDEQSTTIYGAVTDDQIQTLIPVTIIIEETADLEDHYNQLDQYLDETEWGVKQYLFKDVNFELDLANHEVNMQIPDDYSFGEGSANPAMFENILTTMFSPYQIEKVIFDEKIDLGPIGEVSELSLQSIEKENYKMFQVEEGYRKFLVPIKINDDVTIEKALQDMKKGQASFNIYPTIPENVDFSLTTDGNELIISFEDDQVFEDEQRATTMIEAILMTAESYDYELVRFNNTSLDQVGPYRLSESITVPEAINPIYR